MPNFNIFNTEKISKPQTSNFNLSHDHKTTFKFGKLVPILAQDVLPGDKWNIRPEVFLRFAPLISPVYHRFRLAVHFFFVPNRLIWPNWERFITDNAEILDNGTPPVHPYFTLNSSTTPALAGELWDYLGYPVGQDVTLGEFRINPMPVAAYKRIYHDWYSHQIIEQGSPETDYLLVDGENNYDISGIGNFTFNDQCRYRTWGSDYFTSCLPFPQAGDDVLIPLTAQDDIPVEFKSFTGQQPLWRDHNTGDPVVGDIVAIAGGASSTPTPEPAAYDPNGHLIVDVQSGATDIRTLRRAFRLQEFLEKTARTGLRYIEFIRAHFSVKSSDARLQRAEYLGGHYQNVVVSEVLSNAQVNDPNGEIELPQANMAGHAVSYGNGSNVSFFAEEHGWLIGIVSVMPETGYFQGFERKFLKGASNDRFDYAFPSFAHIGEQEVKNAEIYGTGSQTQLNGTFGYINRYAEYKHQNNRVTGDFRNNLDFWHLARTFSATPALNMQFINPSTEEANGQLTRIFAVQDGADYLWSYIYFDINVNRRLPKYGIPTL